jgi:hypothetical protein
VLALGRPTDFFTPAVDFFVLGFSAFSVFLAAVFLGAAAFVAAAGF